MTSNLTTIKDEIGELGVNLVLVRMEEEVWSLIKRTEVGSVDLCAFVDDLTDILFREVRENLLSMELESETSDSWFCLCGDGNIVDIVYRYLSEELHWYLLIALERRLRDSCETAELEALEDFYDKYVAGRRVPTTERMEAYLSQRDGWRTLTEVATAIGLLRTDNGRPKTSVRDAAKKPQFELNGQLIRLSWGSHSI